MVDRETGTEIRTSRSASRRVRQTPAVTGDGMASGPSSEMFMAGEDRYRMIAEAAYYRAEERGFMPGNEIADWLAAEADIDALLAEDMDRAGRA